MQDPEVWVHSTAFPTLQAGGKARLSCTQELGEYRSRIISKKNAQNQSGLNGLERTKLSCSRMIRLHAHPLPLSR
jgi:hypothetical protein